MDKQTIRHIYQQKRQQLTQAQTHASLALMLENFYKISLPKPNYVLSYLPMADSHEVPSFYFEETIATLYPSVKICYPNTHFKTLQMDAILVEENTAFATNKFGLTQPTSGVIIEANKLDIILVPLLAFNTHGFRVGYGKGFYDSYLANCNNDVATIGLSYFEPVPEIADLNPHDLPLKYCITPQHLYEF